MFTRQAKQQQEWILQLDAEATRHAKRVVDLSAQTREMQRTIDALALELALATSKLAALEVIQ